MQYDINTQRISESLLLKKKAKFPRLEITCRIFFAFRKAIQFFCFNVSSLLLQLSHYIASIFICLISY